MPRRLWIHAQGCVEEGRNPPGDVRPSGDRCVDASQDAQHRRFASPVMTDESQPIALTKLKRNLVKGLDDDALAGIGRHAPARRGAHEGVTKRPA